MKSLKQLAIQFFSGQRLPGRNYVPTNGWYDMTSSVSNAGITISNSAALACVAYWACVRLLSETLASLPLITYRRLKRGKERAYDHPLYKLLHDEPNPEMDSFSFLETLMSHLVTTGNCYSYIEWEDRVTPKALWIMAPDKVTVERSNGDIVYKYQSDTKQFTIPSYAVWHIPGLGYDGLTGYSPLTMVREAVGLALATERMGAKLFSNGLAVGGVLQHPKQMSKEAQERFREALKSQHEGVDKAHKWLIIEEGMTYNKNTIPPEDAQFLESRKFQRSEIASFFHIPPHMIGDLEKATFSNIEQQSLEFVVYTMRPWLVRWEKSIKQKLFLPNEEEYFAEFLIDGLLRGASADRAAYYKEMFYLGVFSSNDIREKENMNPVDGGDVYYVQLNMVPVDSVPAEKGLSRRETKAEKANLRGRTAQSYKKAIEKAVLEIVKREKERVMENARKHLGNNDLNGWNEWLEQFYRDFPEHFINGKVKGVFLALAQIIAELAAREVNGQKPEMDKFTRDYTSTFSERYTGSSRGQLKDVVKRARDEQRDELPAIEERLDEWVERRPAKVAENEAVRLANAVAKTTFTMAGIRHLIWMTSSGQPCEFCEALDGQVAGMESKFSVQGLDSVGHPPIHEGCQCQIGPA